jgi:hypothetical protein
MVSTRVIEKLGATLLAVGLCAPRAGAQPAAVKPAASATPPTATFATAPAPAKSSVSPAPPAAAKSSVSPAPPAAAKSSASPAAPAASAPPAAGSASPATPPPATSAPAPKSPAAPEANAATSNPAAAARPPSSGGPRLHHGPVALTRAHQPFLVKAAIEHPELVKRALLVYRTAENTGVRELEFRRSLTAPYIAEVPAKEVLPTWLEYAIELEALDGTRLPVFASRDRLHRVEVPDDLDDARERALLTRLEGRRSAFFASGEYVAFGTSETQTAAGGTSTVNDRYYRVEGGYTYRPLRLVTQFTLRAGIVRGRSPVALSESQAPGSSPDDRYKVGLNYGSPSVQIRLVDFVHLEAELLSSVTEVGFSLGTGGALLFGDPLGTKLTLGFETINVFGNRFYSRMDIVATRALTVSPIVEVTNMPHADDYGVRLLGELELDAGAGFGLSVRGGYQARVFTEGGPSAGLGMRYAF